MRSYVLPHIGSQPDIKITTRDLGRLQYLLSIHDREWSWKAVAFLARELTRAHIVDAKDIPDDVVTMRSRVAYRVDDSAIHQVATLAYPRDRNVYDDALSVLTPIGAALFGLSDGQSIAYPAPDGRPKKVTVLKVMSQPERIGRTAHGLLQHAS